MSQVHDVQQSLFRRALRPKLLRVYMLFATAACLWSDGRLILFTWGCVLIIHCALPKKPAMGKCIKLWLLILQETRVDGMSELSMEVLFCEPQLSRSSLNNYWHGLMLVTTAWMWWGERRWAEMWDTGRPRYSDAYNLDTFGVMEVCSSTEMRLVNSDSAIPLQAGHFCYSRPVRVITAYL